MTFADVYFGKRVRWCGQAATVIDIEWRQYVQRIRIRIPEAQPRTRWVALSELEAADDRQ